MSNVDAIVKAIRLFRKHAYRWAKYTGDVQAVLTNRIPQRIGWRITGKWASQALGAIWK